MPGPRIEPRRWTPPPIPARARLSAGADRFPPLDLIPLPGAAPEDVVVDAAGRLLTGVAGGAILRVDPESRRVEQVGDVGGRPLGLEVLRDGRVLVCHDQRGLLRLDPDTGAVETLVESVAGERLLFTSNAVEAGDGTVYFTQSSRRFGFDHYRADLLEHSGTGRAFRLDPNGDVDVVADGLDFANGVALGAREESLVVAETAAYRLTRITLAGERAGERRPLVDNLPGFPDNIARGPSGLIWVAMPNPRDRRLDAALPRAPWLRRAVWRFPERLQPQPARTVWVLGVNEYGVIQKDFQAPGDRYAFATGVAEHGGRLYLASLSESALAVLDLDGHAPETEAQVAARYAARDADRDVARAADEAEWATVRQALADAGVDPVDLGRFVNDTTHLRGSTFDERAAMPVLLDLLPRLDRPRVVDSVAMHLNGAWARPGAYGALLAAFRRWAPEHPTTGWHVADALVTAADASRLDDLLAIAADPRYGTARQPVVEKLWRFRKDPRVAPAVTALLDDPDVARQAASALRRAVSRPRKKA
ncbi:MAG TPA: SMP-30/gluconolactonase/LRE family protein [Mycobacteriales bacterium]|nr:SMP-30/gluconolactonase/LRE family protein [Mycobacteriales bacterium]